MEANLDCQDKNAYPQYSIINIKGFYVQVNNEGQLKDHFRLIWAKFIALAVIKSVTSFLGHPVE